jgi:two-component system sensor kinase
MSSKHRLYWESSSFKMALLFAALLSVSMGGFFYVLVHYAFLLNEYSGLKIAIVLAMVMMSLVILISFFISIFVVRGINHIANTANVIMRTGDFSQRIDVNVRWDDLSNLGFVLNDLFKKVEQLMSDIKSVSDNIAHDLRTPLTRLLNDLRALGNDAAPAKIEQALKEGEQLLRTFNALLRISAIEYGKQTLNATRFNVTQVLKDVVELYEPMLEAKEIKCTVGSDEASIFGDRDLIFQAIANVLDNALKFMSCKDSLRITLLNQASGVSLTIADTGVGLSSNTHEQIFDRFFREDESRQTPGNGLGLALTKVVIEKHGGKVRAFDNSPNGLSIEMIL